MASATGESNFIKSRVFACSLSAKMVAIEFCHVSFFKSYNFLRKKYFFIDG